MPILKPKDNKPAPTVEELQAEIEHMKAVERIRRRFGRISDQDVEMYLREEEVERESAEGRRMAEEAAAKARAEKYELIKKTTHEYIKKGRLLAQVDGNPVSGLDKEGNLKCPFCGGPLQESAGHLQHLAEIFMNAPEGNRFAEPSELCIYSARNPLGEIGFPGLYRGLQCMKCKKTSLVAVQLVVL